MGNLCISSPLPNLFSRGVPGRLGEVWKLRILTGLSRPRMLSSLVVLVRILLLIKQVFRASAVCFRDRFLSMVCVIYTFLSLIITYARFMLDYSVDPGAGCGPTTVNGKLGDMLTYLGSEKKILNALDLPDSRGDRDPQSYTTDLWGWELTPGHHDLSHNLPYPTEHMRWWLVGHQNSITFFHIDCDGLGTFIQVLRGAKLWGFLRPRGTNPLSSTKFFTRKSFRLDEVLASSEYDIELVVLEEGDRLCVLSPNCIPVIFISYLLYLKAYASWSTAFRLWFGGHHLSRRSLLLHWHS